MGKHWNFKITQKSPADLFAGQKKKKEPELLLTIIIFNYVQLRLTNQTFLGISYQQSIPTSVNIMRIFLKSGSLVVDIRNTVFQQ